MSDYLTEQIAKQLESCSVGIYQHSVADEIDESNNNGSVRYCSNLEIQEELYEAAQRVG